MDLSHIDLPPRREPLLMPWPVQGNPGGLIQFDHADQWRTFIANLDMGARIPDIVRLKYIRAQKLYLLGWIDADFNQGWGTGCFDYAGTCLNGSLQDQAENT
ncbi:Uncharacterised protein [Burkholderia pseudomallei]|uniref:hypothetical protein n=1 Tax=Burkholderia pseudomallei TaxID=28450 RepID=UPI000F1D4085|nr:hypothetical protein [Burkholderia pseudomallei]VBT33973.1 Uncharacterised protein [Burkholderia pseudomallei]